MNKANASDAPTTVGAGFMAGAAVMNTYDIASNGVSDYDDDRIGDSLKMAAQMARGVAKRHLSRAAKVAQALRKCWQLRLSQSILCTVTLIFNTSPQAMSYRHVVLFQFKSSATPSQVESIEAAFRALPSQVPTVRGFEWGTNVSPEGLANGFTHCFLVTFADRAGLDVYLPHPAHQAFIELLKPHLEKALVVDFVAQA